MILFFIQYAEDKIVKGNHFCLKWNMTKLFTYAFFLICISRVKVITYKWKAWSLSLLWWFFAKTQPLRKHTYSNILKILPPKNENFQMKNSDIFHISAQNIDSGYSLEPPRWGGSNEYPQSMFWTEIRKLMYTPVNPSFTVSQWGLRGSKLYRHVSVMIVYDNQSCYVIVRIRNILFIEG